MASDSILERCMDCDKYYQHGGCTVSAHCDGARYFKPTPLYALEKHVKDKPVKVWTDTGTRGFDNGEVVDWLIKLSGLVADVRERYRRD